MKALRIIGNIIIGIILFTLIFSFFFISKTKNLLEGDILHDTIKSAIDDISENDMSLTESQKKVVDDMFKDSEASSIINMILQNYKDYKLDDNYSVSYDDAYKLYKFLAKYADNIRVSSGDDMSKMSESEFKEYFDEKKVDKFVTDSFSEFDKNFDKETLDIALKTYSFATSNLVKVTLIFVIILFIALLCLINWSFITWMLITGIDLILSGSLFTLMYFAFEFAKEELIKENSPITFNFSPFLVSGILQVVFGILLIVIYAILKKTVYNKDKDKINRIPREEPTA